MSSILQDRILNKTDFLINRLLPKLKSKETHVSGLDVVSPVCGSSILFTVSADSSVEANGTFAD